MSYDFGRWGFWFRVRGRGVRVISHRWQKPLYTERNRLDGRRYVHIGPWYLHRIGGKRTAHTGR